MPYQEISKVFVRRICCGACGKGTVYVIAAADSTPHIIQGLEDPDGFVELVQRMMEEQQATALVLAEEEATTEK